MNKVVAIILTYFLFQVTQGFVFTNPPIVGLLKNNADKDNGTSSFEDKTAINYSGEQQITGNKSQNYLLDRIKHVLDNEPTMKPTPYNSVQDWNLDQYDDDYYYEPDRNDIFTTTPTTENSWELEDIDRNDIFTTTPNNRELEDFDRNDIHTTTPTNNRELEDRDINDIFTTTAPDIWDGDYIDDSDFFPTTTTKALNLDLPGEDFLSYDTLPTIQTDIEDNDTDDSYDENTDDNYESSYESSNSVYIGLGTGGTFVFVILIVSLRMFYMRAYRVGTYTRLTNIRPGTVRTVQIQVSQPVAQIPTTAGPADGNSITAQTTEEGMKPWKQDLPPTYDESVILASSANTKPIVEESCDG